MHMSISKHKLVSGEMAIDPEIVNYVQVYLFLG